MQSSLLVPWQWAQTAFPTSLVLLIGWSKDVVQTNPSPWPNGCSSGCHNRHLSSQVSLPASPLLQVLGAGVVNLAIFRKPHLWCSPAPPPLFFSSTVNASCRQGCLYQAFSTTNHEQSQDAAFYAGCLSGRQLSGCGISAASGYLWSRNLPIGYYVLFEFWLWAIALGLPFILKSIPDPTILIMFLFLILSLCM